MTFRRGAAYCFLALYLFITCSAFLFTMLRVRVPLIPWPILHMSYGLMAPYQGFDYENVSFRAYGLKEDDTWEEIDLNYYLPMREVARSAVLHFRQYGAQGGESLRQVAFVRFATELLRHERERGHAYESVKLVREQWPKSIKGYEAMRFEPLLTTMTLVQVP